MTLDTFTLENFIIVGLAMVKMLTWFWPAIVLFAAFCVHDHYHEMRIRARVKSDQDRS